MKRKKDYISEKEIKIGRKKLKLVKRNSDIAVYDEKGGEAKEVFAGTTKEYQEWLISKKKK